MITLNPIPNVHRFDRHIIAIEGEDGEIGHRLHNPFALDERTVRRRRGRSKVPLLVVGTDASPRKPLTVIWYRIAKAINRGAWVNRSVLRVSSSMASN